MDGLLKRLSVYPTIDPSSAFANKTFAGKVVLVTGASGFIATWVCLFLLEKGYTVTGTGKGSRPFALIRLR